MISVLLEWNPVPECAYASLFGSPAIRRIFLTRGFASQLHSWFAVIGEGPKLISEK